MPRPQFTLRALLVLMLAVACFFGGIRFERERRRREDLDRDYDYFGPLSGVWIDVGLEKSQ